MLGCMNLQPWELQCFVAVGRELHFGRAAASLHMSQPALSRQIQKLEHHLGVELFTRNTRRVDLTPAGRTLFTGSSRALALIERAMDDARRTQAGVTGVLRIASREAATISLLPTVVRTHRDTHPTVTVVLEEMDDGTQYEEVSEGRLDVGLVRTKLELPGIACEHLMDEAMVAIVPLSHRLAEIGSVNLSDLADEEFVMWRRGHNNVVYDAFMSACARAGFAPKITLQADNPYTVIGLVAAGLGITLLTYSYRLARPGEVRTVIIENEFLPLFLIRKAEASSLVDEILVTIQHVAKTFNNEAHGTHSTTTSQCTAGRWP